MAKIDDSVKKKVPELRFKGFTDEWEERKLGELASFSKGNGYTKNDLVEFGEPIILYGRLYTKYETVIEKVDTFVNKKDKSIISEGSEVIVPASGESSEDISRASVVGKSGIILGGDLNIIKPVNYIDSIFLALTISNGSQQKEMSKRAQGKSVVHLHNSDLKQVNLLYPKLEEQQKIGSFFKQLDITIALHQRKLDLLKEQKKGYLQKMFPKNGAKVPELRFAGFADDWEERKLGEIGSFKNGMNFGKDAMGHGSPFVNLQNIFGKNIVDDTTLELAESTEKQKVEYSLIKGDVLFIRSSVKPSGVGEAALVDSNLPDTTYSGFIIRFRPKIDIDNNFKRFVFGTKYVRNQIMARATSSANTNINQDSLSLIQVGLPNLKEQEKIGSFFKQLDDTIALHQRKLDLLKEQKKGFLQKMFV
ncbi:TPA: restriction endonuclease subunit S [Streptococcus pyogenes]